MSQILASDLEFIGEWMKKNDVVEFRQGDMVVKRVESLAPKPVEEQKPSFDMTRPTQDDLTDNERIFGVGAVEWK